MCDASGTATFLTIILLSSSINCAASFVAIHSDHGRRKFHHQLCASKHFQGSPGVLILLLRVHRHCHTVLHGKFCADEKEKLYSFAHRSVL